MPVNINYPFKQPKPFADPHKRPAYPCTFPGCYYTSYDENEIQNHIISDHMRHNRNNYIRARRGYERVMEARRGPTLGAGEINRLTPPTPTAQPKQGFYARKVA